jgi:hypothetical protein
VAQSENKEIFKPPHLLIKEQAGVASIPTEYRDDYLTFKNEILGIHAPKSDKHLLKKIEERYKNNQSYSALLLVIKWQNYNYQRRCHSDERYSITSVSQ